MSYRKLTSVERILVALFLMGLLGFALSTGAKAAPPSPGLFIPAENPPVDLQVVIPEILRQRYVTIDFARLGGSGVGLNSQAATSTVQLNLFDELTLTAVLERVEPTPLGPGYIWAGKVEGQPYSLVNLVVQDNLMAGEIRLPGGSYEIGPAENGLHLVSEIDPALPFNLGQDMSSVPPAAVEEAQTAPHLPLESLAADGSTIDLMVVYSPAARAQAGSAQKMILKIQAAVAETNQILANSGISARIRLVHTQEVNYTETGNIEADLNCLEDTNDGCLDGIHALRDAYFADLVSLWVKNNSPFGTSGFANLLFSLNPTFGSIGFSVIHVGQSFVGYVFAHEIGHNLGAHHDWFIPDGTTIDGLFTSNKGYVNVPKRIQTVMAYSDRCLASGIFCAQIPYFANPDIIVNGTPIGVKAGTNRSCKAGNLNNPDCDADNRLVWNNTAWTVANFREPSSFGLSLASQPASVKPSQTSLSYILSVYNRGSQQLTGVQIKNTLPSQAIYAGGANLGGVHSNGQISWSGLSLPPFGTLELTFKVSIPPGTLHEGDSLVHTVQASSSQAISLPATRLVTLVSPRGTYLPLLLKISGSGAAPSLPPCTPGAPGDVNDLPGGPNICLNQSVAGQLNYTPNDRTDVYKISLPANQLLSIRLEGAGPGDADLLLYPPEATTIATSSYLDYSLGQGNKELLKTTTRYGGAWYVVVTALYSGGFGKVDYNLTVTVSPPLN